MNLLSVIVLHEDPAARLPSDDGVQAMSSRERLKEIADEFFASVNSVAITGMKTPADMTALRGEYSRICQIDHIG